MEASREAFLMHIRQTARSKVMRCAYCGDVHPWYDKWFWPSSLAAECWNCFIRDIAPRKEREWRERMLKA